MVTPARIIEAQNATAHAHRRRRAGVKRQPINAEHAHADPERQQHVGGGQEKKLVHFNCDRPQAGCDQAWPASIPATPEEIDQQCQPAPASIVGARKITSFLSPVSFIAVVRIQA